MARIRLRHVAKSMVLFGAVLLLDSPLGKAEPAVDAILRFERPHILQIEISGSFYGDDARYVRIQADGNGNRDGMATSNEVVDLAASYSEGVNASADVLGTPGGRILVNRTPFSNLTLNRAVFENAEGAITDDAPIRVEQVFKVAYPAHTSSRYEVRLEPIEKTHRGSYRFNITAVVLRAPPGYRFDTTLGVPDHGSVSADLHEIILGQGFHPGAAAVHVTFMLESPAARASSSPALLTLTIFVGTVASFFFKKKRAARRIRSSK